MISNIIMRSDLANKKVADVTFADVDRLHRKLTVEGRPYRANRVVALLSKMFSLSVKWDWRKDNPAKGIERNHETKRARYLKPEELTKLTAALAAHEDQQAANIIRLLLLTGARRGEVQAMRWADLDLVRGVWTKPGSTTKQKTVHVVPLSAAAQQLLKALRAGAEKSAEFVFPSRGKWRQEIKNDWAALCVAAGMVVAVGDELKPTARIHDLRHTYASILASAGKSLQIIGALLGHTQPMTTARYAHLFDDPLREATEHVGATISGRQSAEIIPLKGGASDR